MFHYGIITLHEIAFNTMMPWISPVNTPECAREILRNVGAASVLNHQDFFKSLLSTTEEMGIIFSNEILSEWEMFALLPVSKKPNTAARDLFSIESGDPEIRFYTLLTGHTIHAMIDYIGQTIADDKSETFRQYVILQNLKKLETVFDKPYSNSPRDVIDDNLIIRILKLGCLIAYFQLQFRYGKYIDAGKLILTAYDVSSVMASIQMQDSQLKRIVTQLVPRYKSLYYKKPEKKKGITQSCKKSDGTGTIDELLDRLKPEILTPLPDIPDKKNSKNGSIPGTTNTEHTDRTYDQKDDKTLSSAEAKRILNIKSNTTLMNYRNIGILPFIQLSKNKIIYKESEIMKLLETGFKRS